MIRKKHALDAIEGAAGFCSRQTQNVCAEIMLSQNYGVILPPTTLSVFVNAPVTVRD
jgi:hypothetical protein